MTGLTHAVAEFITQTAPREIPAKVRARARAFCLDDALSALVGVRQPVYAYALDAVTRCSGAGDSALIGTERTGPLSAAAFLNGVAIGDFEYEHVGSSSHPASSVFPTALGLSAQLGCSGEQMLTAMVIGYEVAARVGRASTAAVESERAFHNPGINGTLGAAGAAASLLGLDSRQTASALGIAASSSAGLMAFASTGAMTKRLHPGRAGQLGLEAALLARSGVTGPPDVLENDLGFFRAFSPAPRTEAITAELGTEWLGSHMIVKLAPAHAYAQPFVHAINTHYAHQPRPPVDEVASIRVSTGPAPEQEHHRKVRPSSLVEAQYSVPFCVATSIACDLSNPLVFDDRVVSDERISALASRLTFLPGQQHPFGGQLSIEHDGHSEEIDATHYPVPQEADDLWELIRSKFETASSALLSREQQARLISAVWTLDESHDVSQLVDALTLPCP